MLTLPAGQDGSGSSVGVLSGGGAVCATEDAEICWEEPMASRIDPRLALVVLLLMVYSCGMGYYLGRRTASATPPAVLQAVGSSAPSPASSDGTAGVATPAGDGASGELPTGVGASAATPRPARTASVGVSAGGIDISDALLFPPAPTQEPPPPGLAPPTEQEAEKLVRDYWAAIDGERWDDARALTAGAARSQTDASIAEGLRQAQESGVEVDVRVVGVQVTPQVARGSLRPVRARATLEVYADVLIGTVKVEEIGSSGSFSVARRPEGVRIVRIEGLTQP